MPEITVLQRLEDAAKIMSHAAKVYRDMEVLDDAEFWENRQTW